MKKTFQKKYDVLVRTLDSYIPNGNSQLLEKAFWYGFKAHKDQFRRSGEPYFSHCVAAAEILAEFKMDVTTIIASLLHDTVEDTGISLSELKSEFGKDIAHLVDGVTKIGDLKFQKTELKQAENFKKIVLAMAKDIRVIMIKFADRLHNMQTLHYLPAKNRKKIAQETLDVYAPLAHRFGMAKLSWQLEDLSFKYVYPRKYSYIEKKISQKWADRIEQIEKMKKPISEKLTSLNLPFKIVGRPKSYYSIYQKMVEQGIHIDDVYDLIALRIITDQQQDCYLIMYAIHSLYSPASDQIKDYIATPKSNGYRSLHTTVKIPGSDWVEVQIRTSDMDYTDEMGIAAHWKYKSKWTAMDVDDNIVWVQQFVDGNTDDTDASEFMHSFKFDLVKDEVIVFTPKGRLINLPVNSTPVDFAFEVHTEIGLHCIGAKVNSRVVPLYSVLKNGDEVEILTVSKPNIKENWTSFVVTSRARSHINKWLRENKRTQFLEFGKKVLSDELTALKIAPDKIFNDENLIKKTGYNSLNALLKAVAGQDVSTQEVLKRLDVYQDDKKIKKTDRSAQYSEVASSDTVVSIGGDYPLVIEMCPCCTPIPFDKTIGVQQKRKGVTIHRLDCSKLPKELSKNEQWIHSLWDSNQSRLYSASIKISAADRKHLLRDVIMVISRLDININRAFIESRDLSAMCELSIEVKDSEELETVVDEIMKVRDVQRVTR